MMRDDILITLFGGGIADYDMLDKCNYEFEDILYYVKHFTSIEDMDFNDILLGAIDLYRGNLEKAIDKRKTKIQDNIQYLKNKISCCAYDKYDEMQLQDYYDDLKKIDELYPFEDIEYNTNYLDTSMWFVDDDKKEIYTKLLADEINEENEKIGFCELDLD